MKKIVFIRFSHSHFGGAETYLSRLIENLKSHKIDQGVFSCGDFKQPSDMRVKIPRFFPKWLQHYIFACKFRAWRMENKDVITFSLERLFGSDVYRAGDGVHRCFLALKAKNSRLEALRQLFNPLHFLYLYLERLSFENAKLIIANSQMIKEQIISTYAISSDKIMVIHNGIPLPTSIDKPAKKRVLCEELGINEHTKIVLYVGSGFERKGVKEALFMLSQCKERDFFALFIGKERKIESYKQLAKNLGIAEKVRFLGAQMGVSRLLEGGDIFLFPTHYEPFSNACLEAMVYGCALITTRQNGVAEILGDAFVMDSPHDFRGCDELCRLFDDAEYLRSAQTSARRIAQDFSVDRNLKETLEALNENFS
ncbi:MAG: glycosyltransferase family 4 protein [Wolinella sp.]